MAGTNMTTRTCVLPLCRDQCTWPEATPPAVITGPSSRMKMTKNGISPEDLQPLGPRERQALADLVAEAEPQGGHRSSSSAPRSITVDQDSDLVYNSGHEDDEPGRCQDPLLGLGRGRDYDS